MSGSPCPEIRMRQVVDLMNMTEISNPLRLTKSGPVMTQTRYFEQDMRNKCTTIGQALPGIEVAIIASETGEICGIDQPGEICCRGFNTMKGYYKMPEHTAQCIDANGWLHSGDIGHMDANGYYYITDASRISSSAAARTSRPKEVEDFIGHMEGVQESSLSACPARSTESNRRPSSSASPAPTSRTDVEDFCRNKIAWFKVPKYIHFMDSYPQTASGKIQKYKLRELAAELWPDA